MIIGIDGNEANTNRRVGVGQFAFQILTQLHAQDSANSYLIYLKQPPLPDLPPQGPNWRYLVFGPQKLWTKFALPLKLFFSRPRPDIFYSPGHYTPHFSPIPLVSTIHDLGYLDTPHQFTKKDYYQLVNWTRHSLLRSKRIAAVSHFSKSEINRIYGINKKLITVIPNGVTPPPKYPKSQIQSTLTKFNITHPYFLTVGTLKPNKNIPLLLEAYRQLVTGQPGSPLLVIAGKKGWLYDEIFQKVIDLGLTKKVIFTDFITEEEKWHLYQGALASLLVSTYEGFGIPAIESLSCGTPVIASRIPALVEVLKNCALFVDPSSADSIAQALSQIQTPSLRRRLSQLGLTRSAAYTWDSSARKLIGLFKLLN